MCFLLKIIHAGEKLPLMLIIYSKAKLLAHYWSSGFLARAYAIEKLLQKEKFAITTASHF